MHPYDVRDLGGRAGRACASIVLGVVGSLAVTVVLPTRDHFPTPPGGCGFSHQDQGWVVEGGSVALMIAGVVGIALAANALLAALDRRRPPRTLAASLPRAIVRSLAAR